MPRWYYSRNGKAEGPVTPEFLTEQLKNGHFTLVDLVFREGDVAWKTFGEYPEFRDAFQAPPENEAFQKPSEGWPTDWRLTSSWIVLRKRRDGSGYDQDGPFSAEHMIEMIGEGKIDYSQYCWKPGYTRWFRIGNLPEFDRRKRDRENDGVNQVVPVPAIRDELPAFSREELLANVERLRRDSTMRPDEALGPNLVNDGWPEDLSGSSSAVESMPQATSVFLLKKDSPKETLAQPAAPSPAAEAQAPAQKPRPSKAPPASKPLRFGVAALVTVMVVGVLLQVLSRRQAPVASSDNARQAGASRSVKPAVVANQKQETDAASDEVTSAALGERLSQNPTGRPTAAISRAPASVLEIVPLKLETSGPSLAFQTNAGPNEAITVRIYARTGEILKYASYSKSFSVTRVGGELPTLDLTKASLPSGTYSVEAQVGAVHATQTIFIGQRDAAFISGLERHLKAVSYRQQLEKSALYYGSTRLEKLAKSLWTSSQGLKNQPRRWSAIFANWQKDLRQVTAPVALLSKAPAFESAYPEQLAGFQDLAQRLSDQAERLNEAVTQKREIASTSTVSVSEVMSELTRLRAQMSRVSGRPQAAN